MTRIVTAHYIQAAGQDEKQEGQAAGRAVHKTKTKCAAG